MSSSLPSPTSVMPGIPEGMQALLTAFIRLQRVSDAAADRLAKACDVPVSDLRALVYAAGGSGITPKDLGRELGLTSGSVTVLIDRMERNDWVRRAPHPTDRRSAIVEVTGLGQQLVTEIAGVWVGAFTTVVAPADTPLIAHALKSMADALVQLDVADVVGATASQSS